MRDNSGSKFQKIEQQIINTTINQQNHDTSEYKKRNREMMKTHSYTTCDSGYSMIACLVRM